LRDPQYLHFIEANVGMDTALRLIELGVYIWGYVRASNLDARKELAWHVISDACEKECLVCKIINITISTLIGLYSRTAIRFGLP
jgi:hypothetical protein